MLGAAYAVPPSLMKDSHRLERVSKFYRSLFSVERQSNEHPIHFIFSVFQWPQRGVNETEGQTSSTDLTQRTAWIPIISQTPSRYQEGVRHQPPELAQLRTELEVYQTYLLKANAGGASPTHVSLGTSGRLQYIIAGAKPEINGVPLLVELDEAASTPSQPSDAQPPFAKQPALCGAVNWLDFLVCSPGSEEGLAKALRQTVGWNHCVPLQFPIAPGVTRHYVTCLNDTGSTVNRHKLAGILHKDLLVTNAEPPLLQSCPLVFYSCSTADTLTRRVAKVVENGGKVLNPSINADGTVAVLQDCEGAPFCLYHRTDEWDGVKPTTVISREN